MSKRSTKVGPVKAAKSSRSAKSTASKTRKQPAVKKTVARRAVKQLARGTTAPASGNQIRRTFKNRELVIDVVDGQFIYDGQTFPSLSALAKSIVGYGISGPHFFRMAMPKPGKLTGGQ
jgi:hypothetical protein